MSTVQGFAAYLLEHGRSERTVDAYVSDVTRFVRWCEVGYGQVFSPSMMNRSDLHDYQVHCRKLEKVKAASWNRYMASLAVFATWLVGLGELQANPVDALSRAEQQKLAPKSLDKQSYRRFRLVLIEAVRTARTLAAKRQALRNAAVITLLADAGLREGEIVSLRVQDLVLGERKGMARVWDAKGNKDRDVPLDKDSVDTLKAWLAVRAAGPQAALAGEADRLFMGKFGECLQERGIQKLVAGIALDAQIGHVTPHQLRHTAAYRWMQAGANLNEVAELLGHSSIEVTRRYTLPHYADLEQIVELA